jgi:hypothetical protein
MTMIIVMMIMMMFILGWLTLSCSSKKVLTFFSQKFIRKEWFCILSSKNLKPPALPHWGVIFLLGFYTAGEDTAYILTNHMLRCPSREVENRTQARTATIYTCHN